MFKASYCIQKILFFIVLFSVAVVCEELNCADQFSDGAPIFYLYKIRCGTERLVLSTAEIEDSTDNLVLYMRSIGNSDGSLGKSLRRSDSLWQSLVSEDCWLDTN